VVLVVVVVVVVVVKKPPQHVVLRARRVGDEASSHQCSPFGAAAPTR